MGDDDARMLHLKLTAAMVILERLGFHVCGSDREEFMKEVEKIKKQWDEEIANSHLAPFKRLSKQGP
jgi:hypothetical protein